MTAQPSADIAQLRFLVVEDQGFQRWVAGQLLGQLGAVTVFLADDGLSALEIYKTTSPGIDVIVTDLNMPGMDGMEFIRRVGECGRPVSLVLVSDLDASLIASVASMTRAYGLALLDAIQKPLTAARLAAALARYMPHGERDTLPGSPSLPAADVEAALAAGQIHPHFQPIVDLASGAVKGIEALARWHHPAHGVLPPAAFVPLLERRGRGGALTTSIAAAAFDACRAWRAGGTVSSVALNVSPESLADVSLAERLVDMVAEAGLKTRDVVVEVTETAAASDVGRVLENLSRLRMKGFGLSLDDYGTGYSSLQQLSRIPFTEIKIDQSFVRAAPDGGSARALLESSLEIAAKLGIPAVAEGIETGRELEMVTQLGCALGQGYLLCRPLGARELSEWLRKNASGGSS